MKKLIIIAALALMACKKESKTPLSTATPLSPPNHYNYIVMGNISYNPYPSSGDSLAVKVNGGLVLSMNRSKLGLSGGAFNFTCKSGDRVSIYENPGKLTNGSLTSAGLTILLKDSAYQYTLSVAACQCINNYNFTAK